MISPSSSVEELDFRFRPERGLQVPAGSSGSGDGPAAGSVQLRLQRDDDGDESAASHARSHNVSLSLNVTFASRHVCVASQLRNFTLTSRHVTFASLHNCVTSGLRLVTSRLCCVVVRSKNVISFDQYRVLKVFIFINVTFSVKVCLRTIILTGVSAFLWL